MQPSGYAQYRTVSTVTGGPGELLLLLYQAAIKNVGQGRTAILCQKPSLAHSHLVKAQDIVTALRQTLDFERGGEIAQELAGIYSWMLQALFTANVNKDVAPLDQVLPLLRQLLGAWQTAVKQTSRKAS
jgi:flagellar protein FliS